MTTKVTDKGRMAVPPDLLEEVGAWYYLEGYGYTDTDATLYIEAKWGAAIVERICVPTGMQDGECLVLMLDLCKEKYAPSFRPGKRPSDPPSWRAPP